MPNGKGKPHLGFIISLIGALTIFVAAIVYFAVGIPLTAIIGIIFAISTGIFAYMGYMAAEKKKQQLYGVIPMFIGFIIMIATGALLNCDLAVLLGGFIITWAEFSFPREDKHKIKWLFFLLHSFNFRFV